MNIQAKKQMDTMAQDILAKRGDPKAKSTVEKFNQPTAQDQHTAQVKAIAKRRGASKVDDQPTVTVDYSGMKKKDLRKLCDNAGVEYKKKDTNDALIALLTGA